MDIVDFLTARLDEDEAAAVRAARPEPWVKPQPSRPDWYVQFWADEGDRAAVIADPESSAYPVVATLAYDGRNEADEELAEGRVEHIARHDPARVLREVAAKRRVLARHRPRDLDRSCFGCGFNNQEESMVDDIEDCPELRDLAAVYADHKDYDESWRP